MQLQATISYMDNKEALHSVKATTKGLTGPNPSVCFYHGFLLGVIARIKGYLVKSNRESGLGRYDICIYSLNVRKPVLLLELKLAEEYRQLGDACDRALAQIGEMQYAEELVKDGYTEAICYGVGFYKKQVEVKVERMQL